MRLTMSEDSVSLSKLVSLTFDADPEVRKKAATDLAVHDDPAALFALVELSYDKEPSVRECAQRILDKKKEAEAEVMSFAEIFSRGEKEPREKDVPKDARQKVLDPITQIFEKRLGKERAEIVKQKMMPSIEKMYLRSQRPKKDGGRKVVMQEFLTNYLEVISDLDHVGGSETELIVPAAVLAEDKIVPEELEEVGMNARTDQISSEIEHIESEQMEEIKEQHEIEHLPDTFFKKAYEVMMLSEGDDRIMRTEMTRMIDTAKKEITLAFNLAKKKFKETKITNITKIRDGMRNINTDTLIVISAENLEYLKSKKVKSMVTRIIVNDDEGNEGVLYMFEDRGMTIKPGMKIKAEKAIAKTFKFSGETVLTLGKKSNVYIVL
ncbi:hypothetical protein JXA56_00780 [Candidatus Micrarchaeota archaeon]|nr:hypothetical protein [Candidatus Micrarchaeota archaeon]